MRSWKFPLLLACFLIAVEAGFAVFLTAAAPPGERWLGDTIQNSSDVAVYLSYLRQGADGRILLGNLFAVEPHARRFDLVWSSLGVIARTGLPPVFLHELARWVFTLLLAFAVYAAARHIAPHERHARLATLLAFAGIGLGWINSIWFSVSETWTPGAYAAPDLVTEFSIGPVLLGGAHGILSLALLLTGTRLLWRAYAAHSARDAWIAAANYALLFLFHPYFVPLVAIYWAICLIVHHPYSMSRTSWPQHARLLLMFIPMAFVYLPLAFDPVFRAHHLVVNRLPLAPWPTWIATLFPFVVALDYRRRHRIGLRDEELWLVAWIAAAVASCFLPLPWTRKYTEGIGVALVLLMLPAWVAVRDWIWKNPIKPLAALNSFMLLLAASLAPLHLVTSQLAWASAPAARVWFYRSDEVFAAWNFLLTKDATSTIVLADDAWVNVWTPAYSGRTVWVAHDHETPDFIAKRETWRRLLATDDPTEAQRMLDSAGVTHFIVTSEASRGRFERLLGNAWKPVFQSGAVTVLERTR